MGSAPPRETDWAVRLPQPSNQFLFSRQGVRRSPAEVERDRALIAAAILAGRLTYCPPAACAPTTAEVQPIDKLQEREAWHHRQAAKARKRGGRRSKGRSRKRAVKL